MCFYCTCRVLALFRLRKTLSFTLPEDVFFTFRSVVCCEWEEAAAASQQQCSEHWVVFSASLAQSLWQKQCAQTRIGPSLKLLTSCFVKTRPSMKTLRALIYFVKILTSSKVAWKMTLIFLRYFSNTCKRRKQIWKSNNPKLNVSHDLKEKENQILKAVK